MHTKRFLAVLTGAACAVAAMAFSPAAEAQELQLTGPLKDAPAGRKLRQYRDGRFEIAPTVSFTLLDEYRRTIFFGGRLQYSIKDWLSVGVWGGYGAVSLTTDLTDQIDAVAVRDKLTASNVASKKVGFGNQTAKMQWVATPQLVLTPFRGKISIFDKIFFDTDAYIHGGVALVGLEERTDCGDKGQPACNKDAGYSLVGRTAVAPSFGLGLTAYANGFISVGVEYRAIPFSWNRAGFDSRGAGTNGNFPDNKVNSDDQTFKFNQMMTIAVGFSLPTAPRISD
ncbi:MAG: hypothetical protein U0169_03950 [Polyangiaceae bacterium]